MKPDEKTYLELLPREKQREWRWPAVANFTLGGAGAGFHCFGLLTVCSGSEPYPYLSAFFLKLLGPIMVAMGFMLLPIEAGRPSRSLYLIHHFQHSWLSREILFFLLFALTALLDYFSSSALWQFLSIAGAVGLILSQGFIVYDSKAVTAWNTLFVPCFFLSSGMASGAGVALFVSQISMISLSPEFMIMFMFSIAANAIVWLMYLFFRKRGDSATAALRRPVSLTAIIGVGHFLPLCMILFLSSTKYSSDSQQYSVVMMVTAAVLVIAGVFMQKAGIIRQAGGKRSVGFNY